VDEDGLMRPLTTAAALIALTATAAPVQAGSYSGMPYVLQGEWCLVRTDNDTPMGKVRYFWRRCSNANNPNVTANISKPNAMSITATHITLYNQHNKRSCQIRTVRDNEAFYGRLPYCGFAPDGAVLVACHCTEQDGTSFNTDDISFRLLPDPVHLDHVLRMIS
jgi:hypothetical protein